MHRVSTRFYPGFGTLIGLMLFLLIMGIGHSFVRTTPRLLTDDGHIVSHEGSSRQADLRINEVDASMAGADDAEFIELYDGGAGTTDLTGLTVLLFNGNGDVAYKAFGLDGEETDAEGFFVIGSSVDADLVVGEPSWLQNGPDAVALYHGDGADFPAGTPVTTTNLLDALVYDTNDADDAGLLMLLQDDEPQIDEDGLGTGDYHSMQRCPDGAGEGRTTRAYIRAVPTPGRANTCDLRVDASGPARVFLGEKAVYSITVSNHSTATHSVVLTDTLPADTWYEADSSDVLSTSPEAGVYVWNLGPLDAGTTQGLVLTVTVPATLTAGSTITNTVAIGTDAASDDPVNNTTSLSSAVATAIRTIQGAGHLSPLQNQSVQDVYGIVTAIDHNGFYLQDPFPDDEFGTSEGIFIYTKNTPAVSIGDEMVVDGVVVEYYPYPAWESLATTRIATPTITTLSTGNPLPAPVIIGAGGRVPPSRNIDDDAAGSVETGGSFDPETDGIDFYESLEGMLVQVNDAVAIGPTSGGVIPIVSDAGAPEGYADVRTARGGLVISEDDFNPERLFLDDEIVHSEPAVTVGDRFTRPITAVVSYRNTNFMLLNTMPLPPVQAGGLTGEVATPALPRRLSVATLNVENLDPNSDDGDGDYPEKFEALAEEIVVNLAAPDIIALQEIQDNSGRAGDGTVSASTTALSLTTAIQGAGGPAYQYRDIAPENNKDGGQPGGNIRVGFLFRPDRVTFVDRAGGTAITATEVVSTTEGLQLTYSPGRIDPTNSAFSRSRKPLAGEFVYDGDSIFVVAVHLNSKGSDQPLFGRYQPPAFTSETKRGKQAQIVNDFVDSILALDPSAKIIVLGDFNDYEFSDALATAKGEPDPVLIDLFYDTPKTDRYTYLFQGNSQVLDHILVSKHLYYAHLPRIDVVHTNAEFLEEARPTDHDPVLARFLFGTRTFLPLVRTD